MIMVSDHLQWDLFKLGQRGAGLLILLKVGGQGRASGRIVYHVVKVVIFHNFRQQVALLIDTSILDVVFDRDSLADRYRVEVGILFFKVCDAFQLQELTEALFFQFFELIYIFDITALCNGICKLEPAAFLHFILNFWSNRWN